MTLLEKRMSARGHDKISALKRINALAKPDCSTEQERFSRLEMGAGYSQGYGDQGHG
jgi:hypothetical protein